VRYLPTVFLLAFTLFSAATHAQFNREEPRYYFEEGKPWEEIKASLPPIPKPADLVHFRVSVSPHDFAIDRTTLQTAKDDVMRFVLVIATEGGARNITFEAVRCTTSERRTVAWARSDGTWVDAKSSWTKLRESTANRHYAELMREHLCEQGGPLKPTEIIARLNRAR
jgi:hypothetical protein